jgi:hypothetical protein
MVEHEHEFVNVVIDGLVVDNPCACGKRPIDLLDESPVRAMYRRLAREYEETEPTVPDRRGGVKGDLYDF